MTIKKDFQAIVDFLNNNQDKKIKSILPELVEMCSCKSTQSTTHYVDGKLVAIYCYYHKKWELVESVEYGSKQGTKTGLNTMCKEGVSNWTKQQRQAKQAKTELLTKVANGEIEASALNEELVKIEEARNLIFPREDGLGVDQLADLN